MTNPTAFTPDELADRLNNLLENPQQPVADPLLQAASRLINVRPPELSAAAFARIQQQLLDAAAQPPSFTTRLRQSPVLLITVILISIAAVIVMLVLIFSVLQNRDVVLPATSLPETPIVTAANQMLSGTAVPSETALPTVSSSPILSVTPRATATAVLPSATATQPILAAATSTPLPPTVTQLLPSATPMPALAEPFTPIPATSIHASATSIVVNTPSSQTDQSATPTATRTAAPLTTLVIEGKIESINLNEIVIFGMTILLDPSNPLLASLRVGDEVRIEAVVVRSGGLIVMSAVTVQVTSVAVFVDEATGAVFRDDSDCSNPPPAWAPANGWRARCESGAAPGNSGNAPGNSGNAPGQSGDNPSNSGGMGMGNNDD